MVRAARGTVMPGATPLRERPDPVDDRGSRSEPKEPAIRTPRLSALLEPAGWLAAIAAPVAVALLLAHHLTPRALVEFGAISLGALVIAGGMRWRWWRHSHEVHERLQTLDRCTPDLLFETDARGIITFANHRSEAILGVPPGGLVGRSLHDLAEGPVPFLDGPTPKGHEPVTWNTRWVTAAGEVPLTTSVTARHPGGAAHGIRGVVRDQRDRLETERALRESEERFRAALNSARNGMMLVASDGRVLLANEALRRLVGRTCGEMEALSIADLLPAAHSDQFAALLAARMWSDAVPSQYEVQLRGTDGALLDVEVTLSPVREADRNQCTLIEVHDLTEARRTTETLRRMADYDQLTGLPNRDLFDRHAQRALIDARYLGRSIAVLMLDIDRFKLINDTLGHTSGDRLLRAITERLRAHVPAQHVLARFGGDEFLLLAPDLGGRAAAEGIARRVLAAFREPFEHDGHQLKISVSVGVALAGQEEADSDLLIRVADAAMHRAKEGGRDGYVIGAESASDPARMRLALEVDVRAALERGEFEVHYQPQVDPGSGRTVAVEALLRWPHPKRGDVSPSEFVPLLEETGLIVPVGEWVLRTACGQAQAWRQAGGPALRVAVNLSPRQLLVPGFDRVVRRVLEETGLPPEALELELTETAAILDMESVLGVLHDLQSTGVTTAIDDFGVGESWLARLSDFPVRTLKVDRYFIAGIDGPGNALPIVRAIIALGHALGLLVIAEGVETEGQLAALRAAGCDLVQGFYYSAALSSEECVRFVEARAA